MIKIKDIYNAVIEPVFNPETIKDKQNILNLASSYLKEKQEIIEEKLEVNNNDSIKRKSFSKYVYYNTDGESYSSATIDRIAQILKEQEESKKDSNIIIPTKSAKDAFYLSMANFIGFLQGACEYTFKQITDESSHDEDDDDW